MNILNSICNTVYSAERKFKLSLTDVLLKIWYSNRSVGLTLQELTKPNWCFLQCIYYVVSGQVGFECGIELHSCLNFQVYDDN